MCSNNTVLAVNYIKTNHCGLDNIVCIKNGISEAKEYISIIYLLKNTGSLPFLGLIGYLTTRIPLPYLLLI